MDVLPVFLWASRHSSFWLGLSSPTHIQPGQPPRAHEFTRFRSSFSLSQLKLWLICRHINPLGWENGWSGANRSQSSMACKRGVVAVGRREPVTPGLRSRVSTLPAISQETQLWALTFSLTFFLVTLKNEVELSMRKTKLTVGKQTKSGN